ncbi:MAG TPA: hypothetical protein PLP19_08320 [bacterium]|nr:hypothetical protein [bacterium]HPN43478.1 hypothetical protein [bacterium]
MNDDKSQPLNNIEQIRDIIFGDNIKTFEKKFKEVENKISDLENYCKNRMDKIDNTIADLDSRMQSLDKTQTDNLKQLKTDMEKNLHSSVQKLEKCLEELKEDKLDKAIIANKLIELGLAIKGEDLLNHIPGGKK